MSAIEQGNPELVAIIADEIRQRGPMTFARFMELALCAPKLGYYTGGAARIGRKGDFYTSISVGALFGKLLAKQFLEFRDLLGNPPEFEIVEFGGHHGQLRDDVLATAPDLRYRAVEIGDPFPETIVGCVFSNEFLDALPVHRVRFHQGEWRELYVITQTCHSEPALAGEESLAARATDEILRSAQHDSHAEFCESVGPLSAPDLADHLRRWPPPAIEGYTTEINLAALRWINQVARVLQRGFVLTIDYGYPAADYYAAHRTDGTLLCYHKHARNTEPLKRVGLQDITAHVNFTPFIEYGRRCGLEVGGKADQSHFLLAVGKEEIAKIVERTAGQPSKERRALHTLIHPELMGRAFSVLCQHKNVPSPKLSGFGPV